MCNGFGLNLSWRAEMRSGLSSLENICCGLSPLWEEFSVIRSFAERRSAMILLTRLLIRFNDFFSRSVNDLRRSRRRHKANCHSNNLRYSLMASGLFHLSEITRSTKNAALGSNASKARTRLNGFLARSRDSFPSLSDYTGGQTNTSAITACDIKRASNR